MSTEARNARLHAIWRYQRSLNTTRAQLLAKTSDDEHLRFVMMYPLPDQDPDELRALAPPANEVLEQMRSAGIPSGGWDARDELSGCREDPMEVDPWSSESDDDDHEEDEKDEEEGEDVGEEMEAVTNFWREEDEDTDMVIEEEDVDLGTEVWKSDESPDSPESTEPSSPDNDDYCSFFAPDAEDAPDPEELESPTSPVSSDYSDSDFGPDSDQEEKPPSLGNTYAAIPQFTFALLELPAITAEALISFEMAYCEVYHVGASVWHHARAREHRQYEAFQRGSRVRTEEAARREPSKLRNEVQPEDILEEDGWRAGVPGRWW
ncbi:hypothetical protein VUR80DRAFT_10276 [Thermomyces stellatus]